MDKSIFHKRLLDNYVNNTASDEELEVIDELIRNGELENMIMVHMQETWANEERIFESESALTEIKPAARKFKLWPRIGIAAAVATVLFGVYFFNKNNAAQKTDGLAKVNDIAPGKNGATLTLANGKKILINDAVIGDIATQSGVKITKTTDGQIVYEVIDKNLSRITYNTLSTTSGEQTQVRLPDGTFVFLNAKSSLKYPTSFITSSKRIVFLTGEGYFEVAKDKARPFIVKSETQSVEVLGTHFNINTYRDETSVRTTLLEGSIKINDKILKPNEQSVLSNGQIKIQQVDVDDVVAWKDGNFLFDDEPLNSIMRKIERWYDVEVVYDNNINQHKLYGGGVSRYDNVSVVLEKLTMTGNIHFKIEGRRITVMK